MARHNSSQKNGRTLMFEVNLAPQAAADLLEIKNYIENELQNPKAARNTVSKIVETYENVTVFPNAGISVEKYVSLRLVQYKRTS